MLGSAALAAAGLAAGLTDIVPARDATPVSVESPGGGAGGSSLATISHAVIRWTTVDGWTDPDGVVVGP
ncbi:MAG: hypothetical protein ABS81_08810 [Pseudonocardia sp. SCN 72-86]|nr:MAG: hypothetical protein ABS81_08810 [Pseudonocardia sp. SCN 72-86]